MSTALMLLILCSLAALALPLASIAPRRKFRDTKEKSSNAKAVNTIEMHVLDSYHRMAKRFESSRRLVQIEQIDQESPDSKSFWLRTVDGKTDKPFRAGQHIVVHRPASGKLKASSRCYSLSYHPRADLLRITVKDVTKLHRNAKSTLTHHDTNRLRSTDFKTKLSGDHANSFSHWMHQALREGDLLEVSNPQGAFTIDLSDDQRPLVCLAAGIGITPMVSMLHDELSYPRSRSKWLFYQVTELQNAPLLKEIEQSLANSRACRAVIGCSREPHWPQAFEHSSRRSLEILSTRFDAAKILQIVGLTDITIMMCGPNEWMSNLRRGFIENGVDAANIHFESFGGVGSNYKESTANQQVDGSTIAATEACQRGTFAIQCIASQSATSCDNVLENSLLEHLENNQISIDAGCRSGNCGSCIVRMSHGTVTYQKANHLPIEEDQIVPCICLPASDLVLDI